MVAPITRHLVPSGITLLALVAVPCWIAVLYFLFGRLEDLGVAYGLPARLRERRWVLRFFLGVYCAVGTLFGVIALLLILAGEGNAMARHLLGLH